MTPCLPLLWNAHHSRNETDLEEIKSMLKTTARSSSLALVVSSVLACTPQIEVQSQERQPVRGVPIYNKLGTISECMAPDGRVFSPNRELAEPCTIPEDCPGGFVSATGEYLCPDDLDRGDPDRGRRGTQGDPLSPDPRDPATPPTTGPGGLATVATARR